MITFILNDQFIQTDKPAGMTLLDFIRYEMDLKGTKIGCREGDCGACTVLEGKLFEDRVNYQTIVSCLTPLGNVNGKHIATIEGINMKVLSPVQKLLVDHNGTQCGFCTPGFVMSLTAFLLSKEKLDFDNALSFIDGNICRCTGYKSIERAVNELVLFKLKWNDIDPVKYLIQKKYLPEYFNDIHNILTKIESQSIPQKAMGTIIGGGTDLMVQKPDGLVESELNFFSGNRKYKEISVDGNYCSIGAEVTATEIMESEIIQAHFPGIRRYFKLIASSPIRNMGTVAGNIVNASPIGDLSIFFLALNADIFLNHEGSARKLSLKEFFMDYKILAIEENEFVEKIGFHLPEKSNRFNFEKVSKRQYLDIASVNSAISLKTDGEIIIETHLSAGGVSPVPLYLKETSTFLEGKPISKETIIEANAIAQEEISPISDIRGSAAYKRLLLRQLIFAHFIELFPEKIFVPDLINMVQA